MRFAFNSLAKADNAFKIAPCMIKWPNQVKYKFCDKQFSASTHYYKTNDTIEKHEVDNNLQLIKKHLQATDLILTNQLHSEVVINIDQIDSKIEELNGDGLITSQKNIALGIVTADCVPVLLTDERGEIAAAVHAGWRGAYNGIIYNAINNFTQLKSSRIIAVIGPSIAQKSYEVDIELYTKFCEQNNDYAQFFMPLSSGKFLFDLKELVALQLNISGAHVVKIYQNDTYAEHDRYHSYRRASKLGIIENRRLLSAIIIT